MASDDVGLILDMLVQRCADQSGVILDCTAPSPEARAVARLADLGMVRIRSAQQRRVIAVLSDEGRDCWERHVAQEATA